MAGEEHLEAGPNAVVPRLAQLTVRGFANRVDRD